MPSIRTIRLIPLLAAALLLPAATPAQTATSSTDRLFLSFAEDATVVRNQWWEGRLEFADFDGGDSTVIRGVAAFQPWKRVEIGATVGFGRTDTASGVPDGSGATDLDAWGKYYFGGSDSTEFAAGGILTVPTGDDTAGLGTDAFAVAAFGALRHRLDTAIITANVGLRVNDDGQIFGVADLNGKTSPFVGVGTIVPLSDLVTLVGELRYEGERFDGFDDDLSVLGGVNWRPFNTGMLRVALGVGLTDGASDVEFLAGYAANF